jgi:hypothetical protein
VILQSVTACDRIDQQETGEVDRRASAPALAVEFQAAHAGDGFRIAGDGGGSRKLEAVDASKVK